LTCVLVVFGCGGGGGGGGGGVVPEVTAVISDA